MRQPKILVLTFANSGPGLRLVRDARVRHGTVVAEAVEVHATFLAPRRDTCGEPLEHLLVLTRQSSTQWVVNSYSIRTQAVL